MMIFLGTIPILFIAEAIGLQVSMKGWGIALIVIADLSAGHLLFRLLRIALERHLAGEARAGNSR